MLTEREALHFLEEVLGLKSPLEEYSRHKLALLNNIIYMFHQHIPFQNLDLLSQDPRKRHKPNIIDVKQSIFSRRGGLCYRNNVFMCFLLRTLGYDAKFVISSVSSPNNHMLTVVCDLVTKGDIFLVDVGCGYPTFQAIPLNFDKESETYSDSFLEYKFIRKRNSIWRMHRKGELRPLGPNVPLSDLIDGWRRFYDFSLVTHEQLGEFDEYMEQVYSDPLRTPFHLSLRAIQFHADGAVAFKDMLLLCEDTSKRHLVSSQLDSQEKLTTEILRRFPQFDKATVKQAVTNWVCACN